MVFCISCSNSKNHDGYIIEYYQDTMIRSIGNYQDGLKNGNFIFYDEDGWIEADGNYVNGIKNGYWQFYKNGTLAKSTVFKNGILKRINYFTNNQLKETSKVINGLKFDTKIYYFDTLGICIDSFYGPTPQSKIVLKEFE